MVHGENSSKGTKDLEELLAFTLKRESELKSEFEQFLKEQKINQNLMSESSKFLVYQEWLKVADASDFESWLLLEIVTVGSVMELQKRMKLLLPLKKLFLRLKKEWLMSRLSMKQFHIV